MSVTKSTKHQVLINFDKDTKARFNDLKTIMGTNGMFLVNRALNVQMVHINDINNNLYEFIKEKNYFDLFEKQNNDKYIANFNYFFNTFIDDNNYKIYKKVYKDNSNQWFTNYMQYLSMVITYTIIKNKEEILNLNE